MERLLMQLAMAALGQFGAGGGMPAGPMPMGPMGGMPTGNGFPVVPVSRPMPQVPMAPRGDQAASLQLASLATATCLMREGQINRSQALDLLQRQGQMWGWSPQWGQRIPLARVDQTIRSAGGCRAMVRRIQNSHLGLPTVASQPVGPTVRSPRTRSEREGFGLYPYR